MLGNFCEVVWMVSGVGTVIAAAGGVWGNPDHLLFKAVHSLAHAIAKVMQYKAGESADNFCVREIWGKHNKFHRRILAW